MEGEEGFDQLLLRRAERLTYLRDRVTDWMADIEADKCDCTGCGVTHGTFNLLRLVFDAGIAKLTGHNALWGRLITFLDSMIREGPAGDLSIDANAGAQVVRRFIDQEARKDERTGPKDG